MKPATEGGLMCSRKEGYICMVFLEMYQGRYSVLVSEDSFRMGLGSEKGGLLVSRASPVTSDGASR